MDDKKDPEVDDVWQALKDKLAGEPQRFATAKKPGEIPEEMEEVIQNTNFVRMEEVGIPMIIALMAHTLIEQGFSTPCNHPDCPGAETCDVEIANAVYVSSAACYGPFGGNMLSGVRVEAPLFKTPSGDNAFECATNQELTYRIRKVAYAIGERLAKRDPALNHKEHKLKFRCKPGTEIAKARVAEAVAKEPELQ